MVTHNPEIAEEYSSRIVRLQDGLVISDSNPYDGNEYVLKPIDETDVAGKAVAEKTNTEIICPYCGATQTQKDVEIQEGKHICSVCGKAYGVKRSVRYFKKEKKTYTFIELKDNK
jgi:formylmethanofuran dehydrogenase subunit E